MPRSSAGRSADTMISGTPAWWASSTAGWRFATAVPDVVITTDGCRRSRASPSARNAAPRSSMRTWSRTAPRRSSSAATSASACERDPGATTRSVTPARTNSERSATEVAVAGLATVRASGIRSARGSAALPRGVGAVGPAAIGAERVLVGAGVGVGVELGELLLEAADALLVLDVGVEAAQEVHVVVGSHRAASAATHSIDTTAADEEPQEAADDRHQQDDQDPPAPGEPTDASAIEEGAVDDCIHREHHDSDAEDHPEADHPLILGVSAHGRLGAFAQPALPTL